MPEDVTKARKLAAWGVHLYTGLGLVLALLSVQALAEGDGPRFFLLNLLAVFIDGSDGTLARAVKVKEVVAFDGALLDNITDFLTFAFLPAMALPALGLLPSELVWVAAVPVLASGFQFCQGTAKTEESFVGFPSYWNLVVLYLYVLQTPLWLTVGLMLALSVMVFVPIHYVYPSRTRLMRPVTVGLGLLWFGACLAFALKPSAPWARPLAYASLAYIAYYVALSLVVHKRIVQAEAS